MNFKAKLNKVLESLGFTKKFENKSLTADEYKALCEAYQKEYQSTLMDDLAAENSAAEQAEHQKQINELYAIVSKANKSKDDDPDGDGSGDDDDDAGKKNENSQNVPFEKLSTAVNTLAENMKRWLIVQQMTNLLLMLLLLLFLLTVSKLTLTTFSVSSILCSI